MGRTTVQQVVLAVDDDESILDIVQWALDDEGYTVKRATNGGAAPDLVRTLTPALILLDMRLPAGGAWLGQ